MTVKDRNAFVQQLTSSVIAIIVVLGTLAIVGYQIIKGEPVNVPDVIALMVGGVVGSFFTHAAATNGARQAGTAAAQVAFAAMEAHPVPTTAQDIQSSLRR